MAFVAIGPVQADTLTGKVLRVADGDTILLLTAESKRQSVRVVGIDAPEPAQPFGRDAREHLQRLLGTRDVRAECLKVQDGGSLLCKLWAHPADCASCGLTLDVGLAQVSAGMAWWNRRYAHDQSPEDQARYETAEAEARAAKRGLWADKAPVPPWDWRHGR